MPKAWRAGHIAPVTPVVEWGLEPGPLSVGAKAFLAVILSLSSVTFDRNAWQWYLSAKIQSCVLILCLPLCVCVCVRGRERSLTSYLNLASDPHCNMGIQYCAQPGVGMMAEEAAGLSVTPGLHLADFSTFQAVVGLMQPLLSPPQAALVSNRRRTPMSTACPQVCLFSKYMKKLLFHLNRRKTHVLCGKQGKHRKVWRRSKSPVIPPKRTTTDILPALFLWSSWTKQGHAFLAFLYLPLFTSHSIVWIFSIHKHASWLALLARTAVRLSRESGLACLLLLGIQFLYSFSM